VPPGIRGHPKWPLGVIPIDGDTVRSWPLSAAAGEPAKHLVVSAATRGLTER
jgi:hypothetical protein